MKPSKRITAIGIARAGGKFKTISEQKTEPSGKTRELKPGIYSKFALAEADPKLYEQLIRAGMPAIGDGIPATIEIMGER